MCIMYGMKSLSLYSQVRFLPGTHYLATAGRDHMHLDGHPLKLFHWNLDEKHSNTLAKR